MLEICPWPSLYLLLKRANKCIYIAVSENRLEYCKLGIALQSRYIGSGKAFVVNFGKGFVVNLHNSVKAL